MHIKWFLIALTIVLGVAYMLLKYWIYDGTLYNSILDDLQVLLLGVDCLKDIVVIYFILDYLLYKI
ncbi:MAG: hypothetical protein ACLTG7_00635 [Romboutsia sp.]